MIKHFYIIIGKYGEQDSSYVKNLVEEMVEHSGADKNKNYSLDIVDPSGRKTTYYVSFMRFEHDGEEDFNPPKFISYFMIDEESKIHESLSESCSPEDFSDPFFLYGEMESSDIYCLINHGVDPDDEEEACKYVNVSVDRGFSLEKISSFEDDCERSIAIWKDHLRFMRGSIGTMSRITSLI